MDLEISGAASVLEVAALYPASQYLSLATFQALLGLVLLQWLVIKSYRIFIYPFYISPLRNLPGPKDHHFMLGQNVNQFRSGSPNEPYVSWVKQWPDAPLIRFFGAANKETLLVTSLAAHKEVLQTNCYEFRKPAFFVRLVGPIVGVGLLFTEGEAHKKTRKSLTGLFSIPNLKIILPMLQDKARGLGDLFDRIIDEKDGVAEVVTTFAKVTLDVMGVFSMGVELDNLKQDSEFHHAYIEVLDPPPAGQMLLALSAIVPIRWLPIEGNRRFMQANDTIHRLIRDRIHERIEEMKTSTAEDTKKGGPVSDMLTFMLREKYLNVKPGEEKWTESEMVDHLLNVVAAGHETTAGALVWATHVWTMYPEMQQRIRTEALELLAKSRNPSMAEVDSLPYLNNFVRETLRVYTPAIWAPREAGQDTIIQGIPVPKGTPILVMPHTVHRNPSIWGDDADKFDPSRWDRLSEETGSADVYAWEPFIQGPRMCIGRAMALLEFKTVVIECLSRFRFSALPIEQGGSGGLEKVVLVNPGPVLRPRRGLNVKVERL